MCDFDEGVSRFADEWHRRTIIETNGCIIDAVPNYRSAAEWGRDWQAEHDRAVIEAARAYLTSYVANEPITGYKMATQRADLFHAIRLHDEKGGGHE